MLLRFSWIFLAKECYDIVELECLMGFCKEILKKCLWDYNEMFGYVSTFLKYEHLFYNLEICFAKRKQQLTRT